MLLVASASGALAQSATASWDRNTDAHTVGYRLYYGTASGSYTTNVDVGNAITHTMTLAAGSTYYFVVRAYNAQSALGPASAEATFTPAVPPPPPVPPTAQLTATLGPNSTALLTWLTTNATTATINGASVALNGTAQYSISQTTTYTLVATGPGGTITRTATVVVPRVDCVTSAWTFQSATPWGACSSGTQSRTETWTRSVVTPPSGGGMACGPLQEQRVVTQPCTVPPTAQISAANGSTPGTTVVTWQTTNATSATLNGAAVALSGSTQYTLSATTVYTLVATGPGGSATASATALVPRVDCVVSAWSFRSASPWGQCTGGQQTRTETWERSVITPASGGGAACGALEEERVTSQACTDPTPVAPGVPSNPRTRVSGSSVIVSWEVPATGGAPLGYRVSVGTSPGASDIMNAGDVGLVLRASGTLGSGIYYARVAAYNAAGVGPATADVRFRVGASRRPGRPVGLAGSLQNSVAVLSWATPAGDDADSPTGYIIEAGTAPGLANLATVAVGNADTFQAQVPPGTYYVRVRAVNQLGAGDATDDIVLREDAVPGAPTSLTSGGQGPIVSLSWRAPGTGAVPAGYIIEAGSAPGRADIAVLRTGDTTHFSTTAPPGIYYVRVRAVGIDGSAGDASNEVVVRR